MRRRLRVLPDGATVEEPCYYQHECKKENFFCYQAIDRMNKLFLEYSWQEEPEGELPYTRVDAIEVNFCPFCGFSPDLKKD